MRSGELATWRALIDITNELRRILGTDLQETGLSPGDYQVLLALSEAERRRLRSSDLAAIIDWERSRLSHHLGRMEQRGLIRRHPCALDSRGAEVALTEDGVRMFRGATAPHMRSIKRHFADALTPQQFEALSGVLQALREHLDRAPIGLVEAGDRS
jgi:DNA-binding MarR family transcriptional regulator